jgi:hypothetical protein
MGPALRMNAALFRREVNRGQALQQSLNRYLYVLMSQLAQLHPFPCSGGAPGPLAVDD